ncbi:hypothetical protein NL676_033222 [Syzygium grande]|nr:hypothetical protein NL676_033222 [Syzygium grande]
MRWSLRENIRWSRTASLVWSPTTHEVDVGTGKRAGKRRSGPAEATAKVGTNGRVACSRAMEVGGDGGGRDRRRRR